VNGVPPTLTLDQRRRFDSEPDIPGEAVAYALKAYGQRMFRHLEPDAPDELLSIAVIGAMEAAATYKPQKGSPFSEWAFFGALHAVLQNARGAVRKNAKLSAFVRATLMVFVKQYRESIAIGVDGEEEIRAKIRDSGDAFYGRVVVAVAASNPPVATDAEEQLGLCEAASWAGRALRKIVGDLTSEERELLTLHFSQHTPLKHIAAARGLEGDGPYRAFVRRFERLLSTLGKRLAALGVTEMPPWLSEVSGSVLGSEGSIT
jgi:DNA-directed RNA polymerase specialized sigma24 family protein